MNCRICHKADANKTNSHQLPSFLAAMISSNGSYKRGNELMFSFDKYQTSVYATGLSSTKWDALFDNLTEDRLKAISINPVSEDYVFCGNCEKKLGDYLESPYSQCIKSGKKISVDIPLMFWISVAWRLSTNKKHGFSLGDKLELNLRDCLNEYLQLKSSNQDCTKLVSSLNVSYKIVVCKDYCRTNAGFFHCRYDQSNQLLTMIIGDICICMDFGQSGIPADYTFWGLENILRNAPANNGTKPEIIQPVDSITYRSVMDCFVKEAAATKKQGLFEIADAMWKASGRFGFMPLRMKIEFALGMVNENVKLGDRYLPQQFIDSFNYVASNPLLLI